MGILFRIDPNNRPAYSIDDPRMGPLASWITTDIGNRFGFALDALQMLDDVLSGRSVREEYEGNVYEVEFAPEKVEVSHAHVPGNVAAYTLDEVRDALEAYWSFMPTIPGSSSVVRHYRPDLLPADADLLKWEETWKRPHPYRGRIGIPAEGPA